MITASFPINHSCYSVALSQSHLLDIQNRARKSGDGINIQLGSNSYSIRFLPEHDFYSVHSNSHVADHFSTEAHVMDNNVGRLEKQMNNGRTYSSAVAASPLERVQNRIDAYSFSVEKAGFPATEEHLTCPITLEIPKIGVFARTSLLSDICCLYDAAALKYLVGQRLAHPLSQEKITISHISPPEQCHFNYEKGHFMLSSKQMAK
ncbi:hypothetical protein DLB52_26360 [Salmonella enterica subsp. salamae]|nr:hypothetical protein [Salmonella enterica subsp. salamae]